MVDQGILEKALTALRSEQRIGPHIKPELLRMEPDGVLVIEGEVETVGQKRIVLEKLAAIPGIDAIVDRLHVRPAEKMSDDGIRDHLRKIMADEPAFLGLRIVEIVGGVARPVRGAPDEELGEIDIDIDDGVVTLNGEVPSLAAKRLAGVLAWWVPGSRDVINGIAVEPPEEDGPIRIEEAVRIALEKDRLVNASQIRVGVRDRVVRLTGLLTSEEARAAAEADAWYVFGVDDVVNEIEVSA